MPLLGLDAFGHPPASAVAAGGFSFVICYVGIPGNPKCVSRDTLASYLGAGLRVGFVFESTATRATEGFAAGQADASAVGAYMQYLGVSAPPLVFYAVDADVTFPQVEPYFQGVASVHEADAYGDYQIVHALKSNDLVTEVWQTPAWSRGVIEPNTAVFQRVGTVVVGGVACDVDEAPGWGRWTYPEVSEMTPDDINALLNYDIPREGFNQDGSPATGTVNLREFLAWSGQEFNTSAALISPRLDALEAHIASLTGAVEMLTTKVAQLSAGGGTVAPSGPTKVSVTGELTVTPEGN